jgi:6-phosphogluconolactonase
VYVSNADDGDISCYTLDDDGVLHEGRRAEAGGCVMPMAVTPDRRHLVAAIRGERSVAVTYAIDRESGALKLAGKGPLAASFPYIFVDGSGRFLLGASYGANCVVVQRLGKDGVVGETIQRIPTARNPHAIRADETNRFVFVPHLGSDQVFQFVFDENSGRLSANTPPLVQLAPGCGPRHFVTSPDNRFVFVLTELAGTVVTLALDADSGLLTEVSSTSALPPDSTLAPGAPRGGIGSAAGGPVRDVSNDVWASDIRITPDGRFIYAAERTRSTISVLAVDAATGAVAYRSSVETERQPRGFRIDAAGRFMIVSGERSNTVSSYAIDAQSGALRLVGRYPVGQGANWVEIVEFD